MLDTPVFLDRAPAPFRRFAYRVAAGRGVLGRVADAARFRFREDDLPTVPQPSAAAVQLGRDTSGRARSNAT